MRYSSGPPLGLYRHINYGLVARHLSTSVDNCRAFGTSKQVELKHTVNTPITPKDWQWRPHRHSGYNRWAAASSSLIESRRDAARRLRAWRLSLVRVACMHESVNVRWAQLWSRRLRGRQWAPPLRRHRRAARAMTAMLMGGVLAAAAGPRSRAARLWLPHFVPVLFWCGARRPGALRAGWMTVLPTAAPPPPIAVWWLREL